MTSSTEFTCFPRLPKELQLIVWGHAVQQSATRRILLYKHLHESPSPIQNPTLLRVCKDSRQANLQVYVPWGSFQEIQHITGPSGWVRSFPATQPQYSWCYINFDLDALVLDQGLPLPMNPHHPQVFSLFEGPALFKIKHLVAPVEVLLRHLSVADSNLQLRNLVKLRVVYLT